MVTYFLGLDSPWFAIQSLEWAEFPMIVDLVVVLGLILVCAQFAGPFLLKRQRGGLYISAWYLIGGAVFTLLAYPVGNFAPAFIPGAQGAAFSGLWIHDAVGLFVTPFVLAISYYIIPAATNRPIYSHFLSMIGFWFLFFFIRSMALTITSIRLSPWTRRRRPLSPPCIWAWT